MRLILITLLAFLLAGSSIEDARKANEAYENGEYEKAIALYKKAIDEDPENAKLFYNLASAQAKAGLSEEAIRTFEQFKNMTDDARRRAMADYDIGNILAESEKWNQALDYYKESLRFMGDDEDAKHNYELAKRKKKEQEQNQDENQQNQDKQEDQQNKQEQQDQQNQQDQKKNQNENQQQEQNKDQQNQQGQQNEQDQQNQQQPQESKISKADAEKILKALEQKEKELLKEFKKQKMKSSKNTNGKDW